MFSGVIERGLKKQVMMNFIPAGMFCLSVDKESENAVFSKIAKFSKICVSCSGN